MSRACDEQHAKDQRVAVSAGALEYDYRSMEDGVIRRKRRFGRSVRSRPLRHGTIGTARPGSTRITPSRPHATLCSVCGAVGVLLWANHGLRASPPPHAARARLSAAVEALRRKSLARGRAVNRPLTMHRAKIAQGGEATRLEAAKLSLGAAPWKRAQYLSFAAALPPLRRVLGRARATGATEQPT